MGAVDLFRIVLQRQFQPLWLAVQSTSKTVTSWSRKKREASPQEWQELARKLPEVLWCISLYEIRTSADQWRKRGKPMQRWRPESAKPSEDQRRVPVADSVLVKRGRLCLFLPLSARTSSGLYLWRPCMCCHSLSDVIWASALLRL